MGLARTFGVGQRFLGFQQCTKPAHEILAGGETGDGVVVDLLLKDVQPQRFLEGPVVQAPHQVVHGARDAAELGDTWFGNGEKAPFGNGLSLCDHRAQGLIDALQYQYADESAQDAGRQKPGQQGFRLFP